MDVEPVAQGRSAPLGATLVTGARTSAYSRNTVTMSNCALFDHVDDARPSRVIVLDPRTHRTDHYWHVFVLGMSHGQLYVFRADGSFDRTDGLRFDATKLCSIPMESASARPGSIAARRPASPETTPPLHSRAS